MKLIPNKEYFMNWRVCNNSLSYLVQYIATDDTHMCYNVFIIKALSEFSNKKSENNFHSIKISHYLEFKEVPENLLSKNNSIGDII